MSRARSAGSSGSAPSRHRNLAGGAEPADAAGFFAEVFVAGEVFAGGVRRRFRSPADARTAGIIALADIIRVSPELGGLVSEGLSRHEPVNEHQEFLIRRSFSLP